MKKGGETWIFGSSCSKHQGMPWVWSLGAAVQRTAFLWTTTFETGISTRFESQSTRSRDLIGTDGRWLLQLFGAGGMPSAVDDRALSGLGAETSVALEKPSKKRRRGGGAM